MIGRPHLILEAFVPGRPRPKGSMDLMPNGYAKQNNEASTPWQRDMEGVFRRIAQAETARPGKWVSRTGFPYEHPVTVFAEFYFEPPKRSKLGYDVPAGGDTGDVDKLSRNLLDALEGAGVYVNDTRVVDLFVSSRYVGALGDDTSRKLEPGVQVWVYGLLESAVSAATLRTTWLSFQCMECKPVPDVPIPPLPAADPFALPTSTPTRVTKDVGPVFIAAYDSDCAECGAELVEGDEARYVDGQVVRVECCGKWAP